MLKPMQKLILARPWNEIVIELLKEGYQIIELKQDGAVLHPSKPLIARLAHVKEN